MEVKHKSSKINTLWTHFCQTKKADDGGWGS